MQKASCRKNQCDGALNVQNTRKTHESRQSLHLRCGPGTREPWGILAGKRGGAPPPADFPCSFPKSPENVRPQTPPPLRRPRVPPITTLPTYTLSFDPLRNWRRERNLKARFRPIALPLGLITLIRCVYSITTAKAGTPDSCVGLVRCGGKDVRFRSGAESIAIDFSLQRFLFVIRMRSLAVYMRDNPRHQLWLLYDAPRMR